MYDTVKKLYVALISGFNLLGGTFMPVERDLPSYFQSYSDELDVIQNRVRNIIGGTHWASDGTHKEIILQDVIKRFIPEQFAVSSGFIVNDQGTESSKQIDILIYDKHSPVFFRSSNFIIIPRRYVKSVIEVKTSISSAAKLRSALENLYSAQRIIDAYSDDVYFGIFSFGYKKFNEKGAKVVSNEIWQIVSDFYKSRAYEEQIEPELIAKKYMITTVCINKMLYGLNWNQSYEINPSFKFYDTRNQSFNYFVSNLLNTIDENTINSSKKLWYPVSKTASEVLSETITEE